MRWFQVDSDTPNDPRIRAVIRQAGNEGLGALFRLWCHIANHGHFQPGWSLDTCGKPMPVEELADASGLTVENFEKLVEICTVCGHFTEREWKRRRVIAIPAMARRADTYTKRQLRTNVEHSSVNSRTNFDNKTVHTKTVHTKPSARTRNATGPGSAKVIAQLVRDVVKAAPDTATFTDLAEQAKDFCARNGFAYDSALVGQAVRDALDARR